MKVIISDSSAIIDLQKGDLLEVFFKLDFEFVIADVLLESELIGLSAKERKLLKKNMLVASLDGQGVERAIEIQATSSALSSPDTFSLVVAENYPSSILLTGDKRMRIKAEELNIESHGVLWVIEKLDAGKLVIRKGLIEVLECWREDRLVRLPEDEIDKLIKRFKK